MIERLNVRVIFKDHPLNNKIGYIHGYTSDVSGDAGEIYSYPVAIIVIEKKLYEISIDCLARNNKKLGCEMLNKLMDAIYELEERHCNEKEI